MEEEVFQRMTSTARRPTKHKLAIFSCGASGVGKTTSKESFLKNAGIKTSYVYISVDKLRLLTGNHGVAQKLLSYITERAIDEGYSMFRDATCRNKNAMITEISHAKKNGYKIIFAMTYAELPTVLKRVRERITQQTDASVVRDIYEHMKKNAEVYMKLSEIDELYLYNNDETSQLIFYRDTKKIQCIHPEMNFYFDVSKYCK
jgi:predicted ABC-type ATPase